MLPSQRRLKQFLHIFEKQQAATDFNLLRKLNENIYIFYSQKRTETILGNTVYMCEKFDTDIFSAHDFFQKVDFHIAIYCVPLPFFCNIAYCVRVLQSRICPSFI